MQASSPQSGEADESLSRSFAPPPFSLACNGDESRPVGDGGVCETPEMTTEGQSGAESTGEIPDPSRRDASGRGGRSLGQLVGESSICLDSDAHADPVWDDFAFAFNHHFHSILHVFETDPVRCSPEVHDGLSGGQLALLFTVAQRDMLARYFVDGLIPNRLFNGDEIGTTSTEQRLLMSGHILANGQYSPGEFDQGLHGRMCYHWARLVYHYAGASAGLDRSNEGGVMGNFDHEGNLVLGSGGREGIFSRRRSHDGEASTPNGTRTISFQDLVRRARPGDWMMIYNANGGAASPGNHSVIFSHWASSTSQSADGNEFMQAVIFHQGNPATGGHETPIRLGDRYDNALNIFPVVSIMRASSDSHSATDYQSLFPSGGNAADANIRYIQIVERRTRSRVNTEEIFNQLSRENERHILSLLEDRGEGRGGIITPRQQAMLNAANNSHDLEVVVRLTQRLRQWVQNAAVLRETMQVTYEGRTGERPIDGLNSRHARISVDVEARSAVINDEMREVELNIAPIDNEVNLLTEEAQVLNFRPQIAALRGEVRAINAERATYPVGSPERARLGALRSDTIARIVQLLEQQRDTSEPRSVLRARLRELRRLRRPLQRRMTQLERNLAAINGQLPEGMVHPGRLSGNDDRDASTGLLRDLFPVARHDRNMQPFLVPFLIPSPD